jgi:hypothetical protein
MRKTAASIALILAAPAAAQTMQPGLWEITSKMTGMDMPSMPAAAAKAMAGRSVTLRHCLKPEDIAKGPERLFGQTNGECRFLDHSMKGGKLSSTMQCKTAAGETLVKSSGSYTPTSYTATSRMTTTTKGAPAITMSSSVTGRRVGDCK